AGMAGTTTAAYTADVWTSPSTVDGGQNQWDYAVPVRQNSTVRRTKSRSSHDSAYTRSRDRVSRGSRSSSVSRHAYAHDPTRRHDASLSRRASEAGSLRAAYGYGHDTANASHSSGNLRDSVDAPRDAPLGRGDMKDGIGLYMNDFDHENWIHRDKLAKIESEELHQAAIFFQRRGGGLEPSRSQRGRNHESNHTPLSGSSVTTPPANEATEPWPNMQDDPRDITSSPTSFEHGTERHNWDLRRPEEIAADKNAANFYQNPGLRKSSSRIPIPTASPAPISPNQTGREFPMQRARGLTNGEDDALAFGKPRRASEPIVVDSLEGSTPPGASSRPVSRGFPSGQTTSGKRTTGKGTAATGTRKSSAPPATRKTTPRSRAPSGTQRPTTRSGEGRPAHPVNRPEGDPPWLATMYKPDPRLPPEEQMLPTHARRMQQQMWEQEGRTPTTYDRQFAPLAIGPDGGPRPVEVKKEEPQKQPTSPLPPPVSPLPPQPSSKPENRAPEILPTPKSPDPSTRPSTGTGYSTMPKVQEPPPAGLTPKWSPPVVTAQEPPQKEKGCGCCIVM
ncbi:hypothetical protein P170DRAFT_362484, partial [Aspergillus steynii IBT 23096]